MGLDFDAAKGHLNISQRQFDQLDELDGNKDGKIEESIFESALRLKDLARQSHKPEDYQQAVKDLVKNFGEKIADKFDVISQILSKGETYWETPDDNMELTPNGNISIQTDKNDKTEVPDGIVRIAKEIAEGSMRFKNVYSPVAGCDIINTQAKWIYNTDDEHGISNDSTQINLDGSAIINNRRPDGVEVKITYFYEGKEHSMIYTEGMNTRFIPGENTNSASPDKKEF